MGIRGLSSFFSSNCDLLENYKLQNTKLVIDGLNFCYYLYLNSKIDHVHGGDYDKFAKLVADFFDCFVRCGIETVVVFDGAIDVSGRKLQTIRERLRQRLSTAKQISKCGHSTDRILPLLAIPVFKDVLREIGVQVFQCDFEADEHIAALANQFHCPVLSQDSDFYIFDLPAGLVRLDTLEWTPSEHDGTIYMNCSIFYIDTFLSHFPGIRKEVLPVFATVMGNDYIDTAVFENFFNNIQLSRRTVKSLKANKRHYRMVALLHWLQNKSVDTALEQILLHLKKDVRETVKSLVKSVIEGYVQCCASVAESLSPDPSLSEQTQLISADNGPVPPWLLRLFRATRLESFLANVIVSMKVFLMCQVEDYGQPSANVCSLPIRKAMYGIVLCSDEHSRTVEEYDRNNGNLRSSKIQVSCTTNAPILKNIPATPQEVRRGFLLQLLHCDSDWLEVFPENLQFLMACLQYVARFATPSVTEEFLSSVIMSCILLPFEDYRPFVSRNVHFDIDECAVEKAKRNVDKYFRKPQHNHAKAFLTRTVHGYSQLQSCIFYVSQLNGLLQDPLPAGKIHRILNGSFLYSMTCNLEGRANPRLYVSEVFGRDSDLDALFSFFKKHLLELVTVDCLVTADTKTRTKHTRKKSTPTILLKDFGVLVEDDSS